MFPLLLAAVLATLERAGALELGRALRTTAIGVGVAAAGLSILQMAWGVGYIVFPGAQSIEMAPFVELRAVGLSEHPNTSAAFLLIPLSLTLWRWAASGGLAWGALTFLHVLGIILSGSRAGVLALGAIWIVALAGARGRLVRHALASGAVVVLAAAAALQFDGFRTFLAGSAAPAQAGQPALSAPEAGAPAPEDVSLGEGRLGGDQSASSRSILTRAELELGMRRPLTGIGLGNLGPSLTTIEDDYVRSLPGLVPGAPVDRHSAFAGLFAELGVPGVAAFVAVLAAAFAALIGSVRRARNVDERALGGGLLGALVATVIVGVFNDIDRHVFVWWIVGVAFGLDAAVRRLPLRKHDELQHQAPVGQPQP